MAWWAPLVAMGGQMIANQMNKGDNGVEGTLRDAQRRFDAISLPDDVWKDISPESLQYENADYNLVDEDPETRNMQMQALARMAGLAEDGLSDVDQAAYQKAQSMGSQMARSGREAALQDAQMRGVGGSGMEFALREIANQGGAQRAQEAALQQAADSARQRALYNQAFLEGSSKVRGQDFSNASANNDIINQFNMANTQGRNAANQVNVGARNDAQRYNQEGRINLNQQRFNNELNKAAGASGQGVNIARAQAAQQAANTAQNNAMIGAVGNAFTGMVGNMSRPKQQSQPAQDWSAVDREDDPNRRFA